MDDERTFADDYADACASLEKLRPVWQAECKAARDGDREPDEYLKLQWHALQHNVQTIREFWRAIDMTVEMGDERFGTLGTDGKGRGRRGGHTIHSADNDGSVAEGDDDGVR